MAKLQIKVINDWVYLNGVKCKKFYLPRFEHCRDVFYKDEFVIKIPSGGDNYDDSQSKREWFFWHNLLDNKDRKYFAKPFRYKSDTYLLQERVFKSKRRRTEVDHEIIRELSEKYNLDDVNGRECNWAISIETNLPVIFDYGTRY